ncbi:MAG: hypothetical protein ACK2UM_04425 [Anaerolineales bacterium]|jgi:hypothetical protein
MHNVIVLFFEISGGLLLPLARQQAYLDPGSGSYFVQLLLASLMGALFVLGVYRKKVTDFFRKLFSRNKPDDDLDE